MKATFLMFLLAMGIQSAMAQQVSIRISSPLGETSTAEGKANIHKKYGTQKSFQAIVKMMKELKSDEEIEHANYHLNKRLKDQGINLHDSRLTFSIPYNPSDNFGENRIGVQHTYGDYDSDFKFSFHFTENDQQKDSTPNSWGLDISDALIETGVLLAESDKHQVVKSKVLEKEEVYQAVKAALKREILKQLNSFGHETGALDEFSMDLNDDDRDGKAKVNVPASENDDSAKAKNI